MKRQLLTLLSAFILTVSLPTITYSQVVINEIMQSNIDCIMDDINEFPDSWVEIYNGTSSAIDLGNYRLGLTDNTSESWKLPSKKIAAGGYAIVYCDKEADGLHTDFRLDSGKGGAVYLFEGTSVVDKLEKIAKQPAPNIAYGRKEDGGSTWGYQAEPTPGATNCGVLCSKILPNPVFSNKGTVYTKSSSNTLQLTVPSDAPEGTIIRYTTDGSEPTLTNGITYTTTLPIAKTTIIRARLFCDGYLSPRSVVQSYIFLGREQTLPVVSLSTDSKYLNDNKIGIYVEGTYKSGKKNYEYDWRRPVNIELFEKDGTTCSLNQLTEMRISGGQSRGCKYKSLVFYANKRFGEKRFKYEFFPDQRPGQTNYKSFMMRNAGNDFDYLYMRDAIIQRAMSSNVDIDWQAWRPVIVYINGTYSGMLNIRERSNDDNVFTNYNELEDIDVFENEELKTGTKDFMEAFKKFYSDPGHTMAEYAKWLDLEEFMNIYAMNLFFNNQDWPGNNTVWWRPRTEDGRWRIIAKDTDFGLGLYGSSASYDTMKWFYNNKYDGNHAWANEDKHTLLFRHMMEDSDFQREFIDRCAVYMGDFLNSTGVRKVWDPMYNMIKTEYPNHRNLVNMWWPNYDQELSSARNWLSSRPTYFYKQLKNKYSLGNVVSLKLVTSDISSDVLKKVQFSINGIPLRSGSFNGNFFAGRQLTFSCRALTAEELRAAGIDGDVADVDVKSWTVNTTKTIDDKVLIMAMPSTALVVKPILGIVSGIENVVSDDNTDGCFDNNNTSVLYDIQGRKSKSSHPSGIYLQKGKDGKMRKVLIGSK